MLNDLIRSMCSVNITLAVRTNSKIANSLIDIFANTQIVIEVEMYVHASAEAMSFICI